MERKKSTNIIKLWFGYESKETHSAQIRLRKNSY